MKYVILSADSSPCVYQVPAVVADHLKQYCLEFCDDWLKNSPEQNHTAGPVISAIRKKILLIISIDGFFPNMSQGLWRI